MTTVFEVLYELGVELQSNSDLKSLTCHHNPHRDEVEATLRRLILQIGRPGENVTSSWGRVRIFCRNYVNRSQAAATALEVTNLLGTVESSCIDENDRIRLLPSLARSILEGRRADEMVEALIRVTSPEPNLALGNRSFLQWVEDRWLRWVNASPFELDEDELLSDLRSICDRNYFKIKGVGLPLAANFLADLGLHAFGKPDLHVKPLMNMLTLQEGEEAAFRALVKIARIEAVALSHNRRFGWLEEAGGLMPRHLDRVIYLIGSDKFGVNGRAQKRKAPDRRVLMIKALVSAGMLNARYA